MLQAFHTDVAKVDQDVAYVAIVVHVRCKSMSSMFHLFFHMYVASVFIWMLHMFHTYVACVFSGCCLCLESFSSVFGCFRRMLQVCVSNISVISDICYQCFM